VSHWITDIIHKGISRNIKNNSDWRCIETCERGCEEWLNKVLGPLSNLTSILHFETKFLTEETMSKISKASPFVELEHLPCELFSHGEKGFGRSGRFKKFDTGPHSSLDAREWEETPSWSAFSKFCKQISRWLQIGHLAFAVNHLHFL